MRKTPYFFLHCQLKKVKKKITDESPEFSVILFHKAEHSPVTQKHIRLIRTQKEYDCAKGPMCCKQCLPTRANERAVTTELENILPNPIKDATLPLSQYMIQ